MRLLAETFAVCLTGWLLTGPATASGGWRLPLDGSPEVLHPFVPPAGPYAPGSRGVDLAAAQGARVVAAGDGVVGYAGLVAGVPVVTVLHAAGLRTTYEPVAAVVRAGQPVAAGTLIGAIAGRHASCAVSCLHWGLLRGDIYLDPLSLVGAGPVRLLPLDHGPAAAPVGPRAAPRRSVGPRTRAAQAGTASETAAETAAEANAAVGSWPRAATAGAGLALAGAAAALARSLHAGRRAATAPRRGGAVAPRCRADDRAAGG